MRTLTVGGKEYSIEFTIEASLYKECTERLANLMMGVALAKSQTDIKALISNMADVPQTTLHILHAGLLEKQSNWELTDTKDFVRQYLIERKGQEDGNYYSLMELLITEMGNDGFFELIGLDKMFQTEARKTKKPQDHKKKSNTKATEK